MGKYFNTGTRISSLLTGILFFFLSWTAFSFLEFEHALAAGILTGAVVVLFFSIFLPFRLWKHDKRYAGIEESLPKPVLVKASVSIRGSAKTREGYLFLTEDTLYLYSRDRKPYASQAISKDDIHNVKIENHVWLSFRSADSILYSLASAQCEEIVSEMRRHGWNIN